MDAIALNERELASLRILAGLMIPASARHDVPGADDEAIFADIVRSLGRDEPAVRSALAALDTMWGGDFAGLNPEERIAAADRWRQAGGADVRVVERAILQCYYRDDRVMRSLGMETRPPFPKGHEVEDGDWSLLDEVRARPRLWRDPS